jgi:hypothetical protein
VQGFPGYPGIAPGGPQGAQGPQGPAGPPSDKRLKDNIKPLENVISDVKKLKGVKFDWDFENPKLKLNETIAQPKAFQGVGIGFIAQEVEKVIPSLVFTDEDGYKSLEYGLMVSLGIGSIKEQQTKIDSIYKRINKLKELIGG